MHQKDIQAKISELTLELDSIEYIRGQKQKNMTFILQSAIESGEHLHKIRLANIYIEIHRLTYEVDKLKEKIKTLKKASKMIDKSAELNRFITND